MRRYVLFIVRHRVAVVISVLVVTALGHQDTFPSAWESPLAVAVREAAREVSGRLGANVSGW